MTEADSYGMPNESDCLCPCDVPVCPSCGHAWTHYMEFSDGQRTYTDARCVGRYEALYGNNPFKPYEASATLQKGSS